MIEHLSLTYKWAGYGANPTLERPTDNARERRLVADSVSSMNGLRADVQVVHASLQAMRPNANKPPSSAFRQYHCTDTRTSASRVVADDRNVNLKLHYFVTVPQLHGQESRNLSSIFVRLGFSLD